MQGQCELLCRCQNETLAAVLEVPPSVHLVLGGLILTAASMAAGHAVIYKREPRSAALWVTLIWLLPALGPLFYLLLGINRVNRRAVALRGEMVRHRTIPEVSPSNPGSTEAFAASQTEHLRPLAQLVGRVVSRPLLPGNRVELLANGPQAYAAMLESIESARTSVGLASYIFDADGIGGQFVEALQQAKARGVQVRVLVDAVGARYSWPPAIRALNKRGVRTARFNPRLMPYWIPAINLRNHRKILVVDGAIGFTGGLNVKREYAAGPSLDGAFRDIHFRIAGPVVAHLAEVFADDWQFTTGEALRGDKWFPALGPVGEVQARGIEGGPDESYDRLRWVIIGALNAARQSVQVMTPYFLPDAAIISALDAAALRGVEVDILLPQRCNLPYVQWAAFAQLWQVLERGCRVWVQPPPFDHSKLMVVDGCWMLLGSTNWDARSLRLNFEFDVECYSAFLGKVLGELIQTKLTAARPLTLEEVNARPLSIKLRDGAARLLTPYL